MISTRSSFHCFGLRAKILLITALLLSAPVSAWATLHWEQTEQSAELSPSQESIQGEFSFTNQGSAPIRITAAKASCGCTTPLFPAEAIAPGASGKLSVGYKRNGPQQQASRITVTTDEPNREPYVLTWRITAHEWVEITPRLLLWTRTEAPDTKSFRVKLHPDSKARLLEVVGADSSLSVKLRPATDDKDASVFVDVSPSAATPVQPKRATLRLRFQRGDEVVERSVYVRIQ